MSTTKPLTKRLGLGIENDLAAAKQVAKETNVPSLSYPHDEPTSGKPSPASNVTALPAPIPTERKARGPRPATVRRYSVDLPVYLIDNINEKAFKTKHTKKRVVLEALRDGGFDVKDIDIHEEKPNA